jgi:hypothetical protein
MPSDRTSSDGSAPRAPRDKKDGPRPDLHAIDPRSGSVVDRRSGADRRLMEGAAGGDGATNLERRRGPGRRLTDFVKSAEEGEMNPEQFLFLMAIDAFKRANGKTFPTWTDVIEIIRKLGYRKTMATEINLGPRAQDWCEKPDAPTGVCKEAPSDSDETEFRKAS